MSKLSKWVDSNITHSSERKASMRALQEQMDFYRDQKEMMHKESDRIAGEKAMENQRIQEKQIRSLRRAFRRPGFLNSSPSTDVSSQLG